MLNFDVKRKINTLRDILVGKVPDPKAQVEQITIALIYKFMDDMDLAGAEFGGKRVFFAGEYEKYAFTQIMLPEHSAQERLNLYAEGIDKMVNNAELPSLFRDILRGAYIPYRDPETLNRFLKEIAEFSYDNSEDLGNAFEYLLSIMGSQGYAGQFRTPRHIIDMMVEIVAPRKDETILDPACGTAGFLISAYKYIDAQNRDAEGKSTLSGEDKKRMAQNFAGYDISPDMVRLSRVNMYLHGFSNPQISEYDTLTSLEKWDDNYDVILANPPFMTPKGGINPHKRYRVDAKRAEVLFVDYIAEHLNPTGRAAIIVPEGIVFQSQTAYKNLRRFLVEDALLYGVISLPAGVFNPYSGVKTSILLIDRTLAKEKDSILFVKLNNDGYDLGAQRREIKGSEIPTVVQILKSYQKGTSIEGYGDIVIARKTDIAKEEYILIAERYKEEKNHTGVWPFVKLKDVCSLDRHLTDMQIHPYVGMEDVEPETGIISNAVFDSDRSVGTGAAYQFDENHILYGRLRPYLNKVAMPDFSGRCSTELIPIRVHESVLREYIGYILRSSKSVSYAESTYIGARMPRTDLRAFLELQIPLPPLEVQRRVVEEIEGYQKIIAGARQIVQNYRPTIKIDSTWDEVKLGELCVEMRNGVNVEQTDTVGKFRVTRIQTISDGTVDLSRTKWTNDEPNDAYYMRPGDILLSHINSYEHLAKTAIFPEVDEKVVHGINLIRCRLAMDRINPQYAILYMKSDKFISDAKKYAQRAVNQASIKTSDLKQLLIPVPSLAEQAEIVDKIAEEQAIIEHNKRLIEIFEQKITDSIAEVWGEQS